MAHSSWGCLLSFILFGVNGNNSLTTGCLNCFLHSDGTHPRSPATLGLLTDSRKMVKELIGLVRTAPFLGLGSVVEAKEIV